jgi:hypothetical protein
VKSLVWKPEKNIQLGRPRRRWEVIIIEVSDLWGVDWVNIVKIGSGRGLL